VDAFFEGGALGFDFDPQFDSNGYLYVSYTAEGPNFATPLISRLSRFDTSIDPADGLIVADPLSEQILLSVDQPYANHNGGNLLFGPDGLLYYGLGDGGSGGDPENNGQRIDTLLGALLRIDVGVTAEDFASGVRYYVPDGNPFSHSVACDPVEGCPEIYAYGLRNPWRYSFDRLTGELWLGDVGQSAREEIDLVVPGGNYGWRCREGDLPYSSSMGCPPLDEMEAPVYDYSHVSGVNSVTGGYVYRGSQIPGFQGMYVFSDYGRGEIWGIYNGDYAGELLNTALNPVSFAESLDGEIYLMSNAEVYRLELAP
jgi:glucose/arabinose dehydrogenase